MAELMRTPSDLRESLPDARTSPNAASSLLTWLALRRLNPKTSRVPAQS